MMYGILTYAAVLKGNRVLGVSSKSGKWKIFYVGFHMLGMEAENVE
jgi:hypothetical protein